MTVVRVTATKEENKMSAEWSYAKLAKLASKFGGPEKLLGIVKTRAFQKGFKAGKIKMIPIAIGTFGLGVLSTVVIQKFKEHKYYKLTKREVTAAEAAEAEDLLIQGMKSAEQDEAEQLDEDNEP